MKPLVWEDPMDCPEKWIMDYKWKERKTNRHIFSEGICLPAQDQGKLNFSQDPATYDLIYHSSLSEKQLLKLDNLPNNGSVLLVNNKILKVLKQHCGECIQDFPAVIVPENPKKYSYENHDYRAINICKTIEAVDFDKSTIQYLTDNVTPLSVKTLFLCEVEKITFAREKTFESLILLSPALADALTSECVTGVRFLTDEQYNRRI